MDEDYNEGYDDGLADGRKFNEEVVRDVIAQIQRGDTLDAITTLEREFFPKWGSVMESRVAYETATSPLVQSLKGDAMGNYFAQALGASIASAGAAQAVAEEG